MTIQLMDKDLIQQIEQIAKQVKRTPEQIIAEALHLYIKQLEADTADSFWSGIIGLGASGEADITTRDEEILLTEIDPIRGWSVPHDEQKHSG